MGLVLIGMNRLADGSGTGVLTRIVPFQVPGRLDPIILLSITTIPTRQHRTNRAEAENLMITTPCFDY
jgi:hypothetical protein